MMKKLLFLLVTLSVLTTNAQSLTNLVFESTITTTETNVDLTFDFDGVSAGDLIEWQLFLANPAPDNSPNWGSGRNVAYETAIVPNATGSGTQIVSFSVNNTPVEGEVFTWAGKITLASDGTDTGWNNTNNLVTISAPLGVEDVNAINVQVYPNPTSDKLFIKNSLQVNKIGIIDIAGRTVLEFNNANNLKSIDVSKLTNGIYFLKTDLGSQLKFIKK